MSKAENLKFILQRIDQYYNGVNLKGSFFLGVNTFLLGGCLAAFLPDSAGFWKGLNFGLISLLSLTSIGYVLWAILPFLNSGNSYEYESTIFFGAIAEKEFKQFREGIDEMDTAQFEDDLTKQIHILSDGLKRKFFRIRNAGILLFLSIISTIPFFYQIIT